MLFRRKGWLRKEYDEKLFLKINELKKDLNHHNNLIEKSFDPYGEIQIQSKILSAKYLLLLKEAKKRNISVLK
jgi:hypothetical protein